MTRKIVLRLSYARDEVWAKKLAKSSSPLASGAGKSSARTRKTSATTTTNSQWEANKLADDNDEHADGDHDELAPSSDGGEIRKQSARRQQQLDRRRVAAQRCPLAATTASPAAPVKPAKSLMAKGSCAADRNKLAAINRSLSIALRVALALSALTLVDGLQPARRSLANDMRTPTRLPLEGARGAVSAAGAHHQPQPPAAADDDQEARAAHWSLPNRPSLFSIIRFPNEECFDSSNQSGTCYTAFECKLLGGQPSSPCAAGFGSCCIVSRTCHVTTREKVVYFKNPSYPAADSDEKFCDLTVEMSDINVCQLRLDFLDFQLDPPTNGACKDDYMEISASGMPPQTVPRLCGLNRNQHLYITVPQDFSERSASIVFYTDPVGDHRWQVKVTQIDCNHYKPIDWKRSYGKFASSPLWNPHPNSQTKLPMHLMGKYSTTFASGFQTMSQTASALAYEFLKPQFTPRAPMGCLQYFTQSSGIIESFNFGQYLNNMDYSICVQRQPDTCRVVFTSSDYDWSLNGVGVSGSSSGVGDQDCARDYLLIPGASRTGDGFTYDRYCGGRLHYYRGQTLSAPLVIKTAGPIVLRFHSDAHYEGLNNGGFRIQYDQSAQDCVYHTAEESGSLASQQLLASTLADSRPLGSQLASIVNEQPVLYASQQLSLEPTHQLTSDNQPAVGSDSTVATNVVQLSNHLDRSGQLSLSSFGKLANESYQAHILNGQQQQQQQQFSSQTTTTNTDAKGNGIRRADFTELEPTHQQLLELAGQANKPQRATAANLLLHADLNKAFQLITGSSDGGRQ